MNLELDKFASNWRESRLHLRNTKYLRLKTETSAGSIPVEAEHLALLRGWRAKARGEFVLEVLGMPERRRGYRCQRHFKTLHQWLRTKGISSPKPLHALRKEFGSLICQRHGVYAASRLLRHADIAITTAHYTSAPEGEISTGLRLTRNS